MYLDSIQILCVVLWLQSGNVRIWPLTVSVLLEAPLQFLAPLPNQVTAGMDLPCLLHLIKDSCMCSSVTDWIHSVYFIPFMCVFVLLKHSQSGVFITENDAYARPDAVIHTPVRTHFVQLSSSAGKFKMNSWPTCDNQQCFWWAANSGMPSSSHRVEPWLHSCSCLQQLALSVILFCFYHCSPNSSSSHTSAVGWNLTVHLSTDATQLNGNSCDVLWVNHLLSPLRLDPETSAVCRQWWLWDHPLQWRGVLQLFRRRRPS